MAHASDRRRHRCNDPQSFRASLVVTVQISMATRAELVAATKDLYRAGGRTSPIPHCINLSTQGGNRNLVD
jgi:hypothetical protein